MTAPADHPAINDAPFLVGRERERASLRDRAAAACMGRGGLVLIGGEAGIGKTALVESLTGEAEAQGALVLTGRCYDLTETPPYGPWIDLFGGYRIADGLPPLPAAFAQRGRVGAVTSEAALFHQVQDFLGALAPTCPLIVFLDDLHWADPASLDLLRFLARGLATQPILLIATYRTDELTRRHPLYALLPALVREASAARLDLRPLRQDDLAALVAQRYHLPDNDEARLVSYLHERSEGNPFFLGELLRALEEERALQAADTGWQLADLTRARVPALLRQVIDGRVARLGEEAQRLLAVAAVIGQEIPLTLWAAVAETDEPALTAVIEPAVDAHLLEETPDGTRARFVHALIREALYEGILPSRRRMQHRQVAEALSALPDPDPDAVAYHFQQAGDTRAAAWLVRAGDRAQRAFAWLTAAERFEAALALLEAHPPGESTAGWLHYRLARMRRYSDPAGGIVHLDAAEGIARETDDRALTAGVCYTRGQLRILVGEIAGGLTELRAGVAALATLTDEEQERLNAHDDTNRGTMRSRQGLLAFQLAIAGHLTEAVAMAEEMLQGLPTDPREIARAGGMNGDALRGLGNGDALRGLGVAYALLGRVADARAAWASTRAVARAMGHLANVHQALQQELWLVYLPYLADDVAERERLVAEAEAVWEQSLGTGLPPALGMRDPSVAFVTGAWTVAREAAEAEYANPERVYRQWARVTLAQLARAQGQVTAAETYVREQFPAGPESEPGEVALVFGLGVQREAAALARDAGDLPGAKAWLEAHDHWLAWSGAVLGQSEGHALWAQYHRQAGETERARDHAARALAHASDPRQPLALLAAHRLLGELETDAKRYDDAERHLAASLALAEACQAPYERALTLIALAALRVTMGAPDDARALLDEAQTICTPLDARLAVARIATLHAQLAATPSVPAYPAGLSAREVEVLRLVAQGMTDAEAAERLFLSPRTVGQHLRSIYNKLGVSSRIAAARFAIEHGLT